MSNAEESTKVLYKLKEMGVSLAIDDFGTGYSSLSYLKHFPIDRVKVDRSFMRDVPRNADDAAIVSAIIAMAHNLNLKVTAEGVETNASLNSSANVTAMKYRGIFFHHHWRKPSSPGF